MGLSLLINCSSTKRRVTIASRMVGIENIMPKEKSNTEITITRKIQIVPVGNKDELNRVYSYLRDGMKSQNMAMNQYMSSLVYQMIQEADDEDRKELRRLYSRISGSKKGSAYDKSIAFAKGLPIGAWTQKVEQDFNNAMKKGLRYGKTRPPYYREDCPLLIHVDYVRLLSTNPHIPNGIYHNYGSNEEFLKHLYDAKLEVFIKFANSITFRVVFGEPRKSHEIRSVFKNIFEETYKVQGSSIQIDDNKIILNLSLSIPKQKHELDENTVVGVDIGVANSAVCALNNNDYINKFIGTGYEMMRVRTQMKEERKRVQKSLRFSNGGHGRKKKLAHLERFKDRERNFARTYNHKAAKQVVDFALRNHAKYINLEDLSGITKSQRKTLELGDWSYFQLQEFIKYKAERHGIVVRFIDPKYTSQTCSCCGNLDEGQRKSQPEFICKNPKCSNYGVTVHADFNAARNIAMSTNFVDKAEKKKKKKHKKSEEPPASNTAIAVA